MLTINAGVLIGINDQVIGLYLSKKACQPYIESEALCDLCGVSMAVLGGDDVISIILTPVMVLCFRGRLRVGILRFLKMVMMVLR